MSQHKKKKMKQPTRLRTLVASLMLIMPAVHAANDTEFSSRPLVGVVASFAPHIALALSVEFPTAGAAYSQSTMLSVSNTAGSSPLTQTYLGYFDNTKCYKYRHNSKGYFYPTSKAQTLNGNYGLCNAGGETEEFSGNMLNFMTMTAVDIFRSTMTGGNRAFSDSIDAQAYTEGDTTTETFLRRAKVQYDQNGASHYKISDRQLDVFNTRGEKAALLKRLMPHYFIDVMAKDLVDGETVTGDPDNTNQAYGKPARLHFRSLNFGNIATFSLAMAQSPNGSVYTPEQTVTQGLWQAAGEFDRFSDNQLHFFNNGFNLHIVRKVSKGMRRQFIHRATGSNVGKPTYASSADTDLGLKGHEYWAVVNSDTVDTQYRDNARRWQKPLNVVIKVCDPAVGLEENCEPYGNNYKPEGLLQEYTKSHGMRFATFGYLNIGGNGVDGGVLRSRMKSLIGDKKQAGETYSTVYGDEWSSTTGIFETNPDTTDAQQSGVSNSGTINYLNKFGDKSGYKAFDPAGELYETALAYLRGTHVGNGIYKPADSLLNDNAKDGFPAIYDWDDPYKRGVEELTQHCHANSIILIGDTNTHADNNVISANSKASSYLTRLLDNELGAGHGLAHSENFGASSSPAYMAGLAYWARTNNIRPDLKYAKERPINSGNFIIDVVENGDYKNSPMRNTYYLAAKYGGFNIAESSRAFDLNENGDNNKPLPLKRDSWTDEGATSSISAFPNGVPRNFAIANNPAAMKDALGKAIASSAALNNPSQAATGLSIGTGEILDLRSEGLNYLLQSTYDYANLTGDVVVYKPSWVEKTNANGTVERGFGLAEHARTGKLMKEQFHGTGYATRKVFTVKGNQTYEFTSANASNIFAGINMPNNNVSAAQLTNYILGDNSLEGGTLRERAGLQGTVINSTATPILKAKAVQCAAPFSDAAAKRPTYYAAAANDGMLHIFDTDGSERMAYMAGTALEKLPEFAKIGFQHQYLNDGTPVIQDLCLNNTSQTVLIGTTGRGGKAVYALNVTDLSKPSSKNVMWEFTHADLGLTVSKPIITKGKDGKQYAIVSSGYQTDGQATDNGYIFILDIGKTGDWLENRNFWKIKLGNAGVGAPFVYDGENDGIGDKIFVGDLEGKVWQLNRTESGTVPFELKYNGPLFKPNDNFVRPITGAPYAEMVDGKLMVTVGTGRYFSDKDLSTTQANFAYGLIVDDKNPIVDNASNILEQRFVETLTGARRDTLVHTVTEHKMDKHKGWRLSLVGGMNVASPSLIRQRQVAHFVFARNTGDISASCVRGANAGVIEVDVRNGGRFSKPLIDTNGDGKFDKDDNASAAAIEFIGMNTSVGTFLNFRNPVTGAIVPAVYFNDGGSSSGGLKLDPNDPAGRLITLNQLGTEAGVRRISWREIF